MFDKPTQLQYGKTLIYIMLGIFLVGALFPTLVDALVTMTVSIFTGTPFETAFSGGLIVIGVVGIAVLGYVIREFNLLAKV